MANYHKVDLQPKYTLRRRLVAEKVPAIATVAQPLAAQLQRTIGNRALGYLTHQHTIQAKLTLGAVGDRYEQEADQVAKQVVQQMEAPAATVPGAGQATQRQAAPNGEEEEPLAAKRLPIALQRAASPEEEEQLATNRLPLTVQRESLPEEEEPAMQAATLQRTAGLEGGPVHGDIETAIQRARGNGQPLQEGVRSSLEHSFGADFSGVHVHTDGEAHTLNQQLQARAFTTGKDIFFHQGEYNPTSRNGRELLAHELTHVVQQTGRG